MGFAKHAVLSLRVPLSLCFVRLSLSILVVGLFVLGLYILTCITLHVNEIVIYAGGKYFTIRNQNSATEPARHMRESGSLN